MELKLKKKIKIFAEAVFAEFGHFKSARKITKERPEPRSEGRKWEKHKSVRTTKDFLTARGNRENRITGSRMMLVIFPSINVASRPPRNSDQDGKIGFSFAQPGFETGVQIQAIGKGIDQAGDGKCRVYI